MLGLREVREVSPEVNPHKVKLPFSHEEQMTLINGLKKLTIPEEPTHAVFHIKIAQATKGSTPKGTYYLYICDKCKEPMASTRNVETICPTCGNVDLCQ